MLMEEIIPRKTVVKHNSKNMPSSFLEFFLVHVYSKIGEKNCIQKGSSF
jgi:hypothetical protein